MFVARGGDAKDGEPAYSVPPRTRAPIVRERRHDGEVLRNVDLASGGLSPSWVKDGGLAPVNPRVESAATNGIFRPAFAGEEFLAATGLYVPRKDPARGVVVVVHGHYARGP